MKMSEIDIVYQELKKSKKYKYLCDETLYRISDWALKRFDGRKAVKAAKKKLHQVYGAYFETFQPGKIQKLLDQIPGHLDEKNLKTIALEIMESHTSTSERILFMEQFYPDLFKRIGKPKKILDLACGLHPFAVLWMDLEQDAEYYAFDIDTRLIDQISSFFNNLSHRYKSHCSDILVSIPEIEADVVFLLKTLPCLERQEKGVSEKIITSLKAKHIVISFPSKSLTGKAKGMENYYHTFALELINRLNLEYFKLEYPNEVFYLLNKKFLRMFPGAREKRKK
jgi:16S rRNA (guanine(1405)-N(7))-methyltransferase